jgi:hypothetical protein
MRIMNSNKKQLLEIKASGSYYDIGYTIGQGTKKQIHQIIEQSKTVWSKKAEVEDLFRKYMTYVEQYPFIMDELKGMADGAEVEFNHVAMLSIVELNKNQSNVDDCSSFIIKNDNKIILAHNEDGEEGSDIFLLRATYPSGTEVLSFSYFGSLVGLSVNLNSHGLLIMCNALHANDQQIGEPKRVFARRLVECHDFDEVLEIIRTSKRAQGQNFTIGQFGKIMGVETSATDFFAKEIVSNGYHCNNYLFSEMISYEAGSRTSEGYLRTQEGEKAYRSLIDLQSVKTLLSSHKNRPYCFCAHGDEKGDALKTLGSIFFDCLKKEIWVGFGHTCTTEMRQVSFNYKW